MIWECEYSKEVRVMIENDSSDEKAEAVILYWNWRREHAVVEVRARKAAGIAEALVLTWQEQDVFRQLPGDNGATALVVVEARQEFANAVVMRAEQAEAIVLTAPHTGWLRAHEERAVRCPRAGNAHCIGKRGRRAVDSRDKPDRANSVRYSG